MRLVHIVYGNLIIALVEENSENPLIETYRAEYCNLVEKYPNIDNDIQYRNVLIEMFRQAGINDYYHVIIQGYKETMRRLREKDGEKVTAECIANEVSTLRMLVNGNFTLKEIVKDLNLHFKYYRTVSTKELLFAYKELYSAIELMPGEWQRSFHNIFRQIKKYYETVALSEIDAIITKLDEYDVYSYVDWLRHKMFILKAIHGRQYYSYVEPLHVAVIEKCHREELYREELRERMLWLDDMTSQEIWNLNEEYPKYIMENPDLVQAAVEMYEQYKDYPDVWEFSILLSWIFRIMHDTDRSRKYLHDFLKKNVDVHSFAGWFRLKYYNLLRIHGMDDKVDYEDFARVAKNRLSSVNAKEAQLSQN
jgi:hypothetical protein